VSADRGQHRGGLLGKALFGSAALGLIGCAAGALLAREHFYFAYLTAFMTLLTALLGMMFLVLLHHATDSGWSVVVRRPAEGFLAAIPIMALLFVPIAWMPDIRIGNVAGKQVGFFSRADIGGHLLGDLQGRPVQGFQQIFLVDDAHLFPMGIVGERQDHVGSGMLKVLVERAKDFRVFQRHFGHKFAGGEIPPSFHFEQEAFGANHAIIVQTFDQSAFHGRPSR
jgi:uncharacterized membrane protein YeaQ/YmgE (transglycosylase-associated protein family)